MFYERKEQRQIFTVPKADPSYTFLFYFYLYFIIRELQNMLNMTTQQQLSIRLLSVIRSDFLKNNIFHIFASLAWGSRTPEMKIIYQHMHRGVKQNLMTEGDRCNLIKILESILENKTSANITGRSEHSHCFQYKMHKSRTFTPHAQPIDLLHPPHVTKPTHGAALRRKTFRHFLAWLSCYPKKK